MSKAKPTPAPWELRGWSIKHPGNGHRICIIEQPDKGLRQFGGGDYEEMLDECKANAELIAMAPMLAHANVQQAEELKALRSRLAEFDGFPNLTAMRECMVATADENAALRAERALIVTRAENAEAALEHVTELYTQACEQRGDAEKWHEAALRLGESVGGVGPDGYYNMTPEAWLTWAIDAHLSRKQP